MSGLIESSLMGKGNAAGATLLRVSLGVMFVAHSVVLKLFVFGSENSGQVRLVALLDNLGKGASGAAVQNLNLMLGLDEAAGLEATALWP